VGSTTHPLIPPFSTSDELAVILPISPRLFCLSFCSYLLIYILWRCNEAKGSNRRLIWSWHKIMYLSRTLYWFTNHSGINPHVNSYYTTLIRVSTLTELYFYIWNTSFYIQKTEIKMCWVTSDSSLDSTQSNTILQITTSDRVLSLNKYYYVITMGSHKNLDVDVGSSPSKQSRTQLETVTTRKNHGWSN